MPGKNQKNVAKSADALQIGSLREKEERICGRACGFLDGISPAPTLLAPRGGPCDKTFVSTEVRERRRSLLESLSIVRLTELLRPAFPGSTIKSFEQLQGGCSNVNLLIRFYPEASPVVLRIYVHHAACKKEIDLLTAARTVLPVPEIIYADETGKEGIGPYVLYSYIEGTTFQELKKSGSPEDISQAAFAMGETLSCLQNVPVPYALSSSPYAAVDEFLHSPTLRTRLGARGIDELSNFLSVWRAELASLNKVNSLVHGDFNNRNTILRRKDGRWRVVGVLDWESAFSGSPLWDAARFICYEKKSRPCREPHFSDGFRAGGGKLPDRWDEFSRVVNAVSAAHGLSCVDLQAQFVPELCALIAAITNGRDPD